MYHHVVRLGLFVALILSIVVGATARADTQVVTPVTIWPDTATPEVASAPDTGAVELGVKFRSTVAGSIVGLRFYKGSSNTGTHVGNVWTGTGQRLATATFMNETASGWQQVNFSTPVPITANTTYVASYYAPAGGYSADQGYFAATGVVNGPLEALRDGTDGGNGVYKYGASGFPASTYRSNNYWVDVLFVPDGSTAAPETRTIVPTPTSTPTPTTTTTVPTSPTSSPTATMLPTIITTPTTNQPALLKSYVIRPYPEYQSARYTPRAMTVAPYVGWDRLNLPGGAVNAGINTTMNIPDWLTLQLNRPATLAIVWRGYLAPPTWMNSWSRAENVTLGGSSYATYRKSFPAGTVTLGGVNNPGTNASQATYLVLFAESDGKPSPAPVVPGGREVPRPNATCSAWVHDQYTAAGPDGKSYPTWHAQVDPVYWCYFRHEHGSDPTLFSATYKPLYGYSAAQHGMEEPHAGFKNYVYADGYGQKWIFTQHFGTASLNRACARFHTTDIAAASATTNELLADLHLMGDYGKSVVNRGDEPLTPPSCPNQAAQADAEGSNGIRKLPAASRDSIGYEPWRVDGTGNIIGLNTNGLTFNTPRGVVICNTLVCDQAVATRNTGEFRFFSFVSGFGIRAGSNTGEFYTDARGKARMSAGQMMAVRQYVKPGINISLPGFNGDDIYPIEPWRMMYQGFFNPGPNPEMNLEGALQSPN